MILAMLLFTARAVRRRWSWACLLTLLAGPAAARGQAIELGNMPPGAGAFVPYRGGTVGVMPSFPLGPAMNLTAPSRPMGRMPGSAALGLRDGLMMLQPHGTRGGMAPAPRFGGPGGMRPTPRRAVGSAPFGTPPTFRGPVQQATPAW